jgi:hypothetical protein
MTERLGLENRDPETPPRDSLAEAIVLSYVLHQAPAKVLECDLLPLLVNSPNTSDLARPAARLPPRRVTRAVLPALAERGGAYAEGPL